MSPFSEMTEMDQITGRLTYLEIWPGHALHLINPNPSTHGDIDWGWASQGFSEMTEMDQITGRLTYLEIWPGHALHLINPNPSTHGDIDWGWASQGCYPKVIVRSL